MLGGWGLPLSVSFAERVVVWPSVGLGCVPEFCYLGDALGLGRCGGPGWDVLGQSLGSWLLSWRLGVQRAAWGEDVQACVQGALMYGAGAWAVGDRYVESWEGGACGGCAEGWRAQRWLVWSSGCSEHGCGGGGQQIGVVWACVPREQGWLGVGL